MTGMSSAGVSVALRTGRALSPMQRDLWASQLNNPTSPVQNMPRMTRIHGPIEPERLATAFASVVSASDVLRTRIVGPGPEVTLQPIDDLQPSEIITLGVNEVTEWAEHRAVQTLDLSVSGYDSVIITHHDGTVSWFLNLHHVITDARSSSLVVLATADAYHELAEADRSPVDPSRSYYRWTSELNEKLENAEDKQTKRAIAFWRDRQEAPRVGRLYTENDTSKAEAARVSVELGPELLTAIDQRMDSDYRLLTDDLAWSAVLTTAMALYLHAVGGADRFSIGLPVHHRKKADTAHLIGPTMEVFPVDIQIEQDDTFRSLHGRIVGSLMTTLGAAIPGTSPAGDFEAVVNIIPQLEELRFGPYETSTIRIHPGAVDPNHLVRIQRTIYPAATGDDGPLAGLDLGLDIRCGVTGPANERRAGGHFLAVLEAMMADPDQPIGGESLCEPAELELLERWETRPDFSSDTGLLIDRLRTALRDRPDIAVEDGTRSLTGTELIARAEAVAGGLTAMGVSRGVRVGIGLPRSIEAVVATLAVHLAGGSFVPLDQAVPPERRRRLSERAACLLDLTSAEDLEKLAATDPGSDSAIEARTGSDEAYLLFTSGSTGEPKGVPISDLGLARYLRFAEETYVATDGRAPIAPLFSALTFDLTITSLFVPMLAGGRLIVIEEDGPAGLSAIAARPDINWCKATPSHLEILVRLLPDHHLLRTLIVGGEAFGANLAARLLAAIPDLAIFNEYGPTEAVVGCMDYRVEPDLLATQPDVPIGRPAPGVTLLVVDEHLRRVPIGSPGELLISHQGLTVGYLTEPSSELDAADGPFVELEGKRFYRSGDLVRLQDEDRLVYLGRIDEQVKVGGIRLEPVEVEAALDTHPLIERSAVRLWSPSATTPAVHCVRCGLPDNVPGIGFDPAGVCDTCHDYDRVAPVAESWFKNTDDLKAKLAEVRQRATGDYDCVHLLSGGKDSTYALYQLVELGFRPYALTLDNGFISEGAKENVRQSVAELGIPHEFATSKSMNAIFRDSLERHSNVCHGCYKTIYTLATNRAAEIGAPLIVTGLSRGQLFETRLIPQQFSDDRFDPAAIDRAVLEARKVYHRADDGPNRLLDTTIFEDDRTFEEIEYIDFYRYIDVELSEMLEFLNDRAPWVRPADTGRSTNCLINAAGIHTHQTERGYHNYAVPYAWDVRLGHKTRAEAIEELDDQLDLADVGRMLAEVDYQPNPRRILTAWLEQPEQADPLPDPTELRTFLAKSMPAHAIPSAFVAVDRLPLTTNGKLDTAALPAPDRVHRPGPSVQLLTATPLERSIIDVWERILRIEPLGPEDDFFSLGGDSLGALEMIVALAETLGDPGLGEDLAFTHTSPRTLAAAIELRTDEADQPATVTVPLDDYRTSPGVIPARSEGELAILFDQNERPQDVMYNVGRIFRVSGPVDHNRFEAALRTVAARHQPLRWSHGSPRLDLDPTKAVQFVAETIPVPAATLDEVVSFVHRSRFDLENGPLLRCLVQPLDDGTTAVVLAIHHASGDAASFVRLWEQIDDELAGRPAKELPIDYSGFSQWQQDTRSELDQRYWLDASGPEPASELAIPFASTADGGKDGFLTTTASVGYRALQAGARTGPAALALAAVAATIGEYSAGPEVEIGLITSTRSHPAAENLFGYFLNTVPVRLPQDPEATNATRNRQSSVAMGEALAHRTYPTARIVSDRRAAGLPEPNLDVLMAFDHLDEVTLDGAPTTQRVLYNGTAVAPLTFFFEVRGDSIDLSMEYRGSVVSPAVAEDLLSTVDSWLLRLAGEDPAKRRTVDGGLENTSLLFGQELPEAGPVLDRIAGHLSDRALAEEPAVRCGSETLTWGALAKRTAAVSATLEAAGVGPGDRVLLCVDRSVNLVAAMLGIQLAGAAYVPIDPGYPDARIDLIASAAGAAAAIVDRGGRTFGERTVNVDDTGINGAPWSELTDSQPVLAGGPNDAAYVIFTSGSTGTPRGVAVTRRQLDVSTNARLGFYPAEPERFLMLSSPAFDSSIVGLFWTLAAGGTVQLPTETETNDLAKIRDLLATEPTHTLMVPTLYRGLLTLERSRRSGAAARRWAEHVIVAGEACPPSLVAAHFDAFPESQLTNEYGPTESTVWATAHRCSPDDEAVPIGFPIPGAWIAVIDNRGSLRPRGVEGELVIGGPGVVDGYLNDLEATAERFGVLDHPSMDTGRGRYFRTGDRGAIVDKTVLFLGRTDTQLNIGGLRAEPEDIENALLTTEPGGDDLPIREVVVTAVDVRSTDELLTAAPVEVTGEAMAVASTSDDPALTLRSELLRTGTPELRLVAHLETDPPVADDTAGAAIVAAVRRRAASHLPSQLRPTYYELHPSLPRTPNGKLDRAAAAMIPLSDRRPPVTDEPATAVDGVGDGSPGQAGDSDQSASLRAELTGLFGRTLRINGFGPDDSFFDNGGHSLLAMELLLDVEDRYSRRLSAAVLYDAPTPRLLADRLYRDTMSAKKSFLVPIQPDGTRPPIFAVHVLGIDCEFFRPLAAHLGRDQPMYGLGQPTDDLDTVGPTDVTGVAAGYAETIADVAPDGPIALAAISLGGVVAYELAQQLIALGRDVTLLALFDALGPDADTYLPSIQKRLEAHVLRAKQDPARYMTEQAEHQAKRLKRTSERANLAVRSRLNLRSDHRLEIRRFIEENVNAQAAYVFDPYPGDMLVVKAADDPFAEMQLDAGMGWTTVATGDLSVTEAPGGHLSMMAEPNVSVVADALRASLAQQDGASERHGEFQRTERILTAGLRSGKLAASLVSLERQLPLDAAAARLATDTDQLLRALAVATETLASEVAAHLATNGVPAKLVPVPRHLQHATATVRLDEDEQGRTEGIAQEVIRLMADLDFHRVTTGQRDEKTIDFVRRGQATARIRIVLPTTEDRSGPLDRIRRLATDMLPRPLPDEQRSNDLGIFLGTPLGLIRPLLEFSNFAADELIVDLGCGDGRVLIEAATSFGGRGRGYETDPDLVDRARAAVEVADLTDRIEIIHADAAEAPLHDANLVFAFLPPETVTALLVSTLNRMPTTARLLNHEQLPIRFPVAPERSALLLGPAPDDPLSSGITVASLWPGRGPHPIGT